MATSSDRNCGGRDLDTLVANYFCEEWKTKYKVDARSNPKAWMRLMLAAEKTRKVLSANLTAPINIECFIDDKDVAGSLER